MDTACDELSERIAALRERRGVPWPDTASRTVREAS
jgi:hypothetical protein